MNFRIGSVSSIAQRALRDRLMSRGKNCLPTVLRQFLTRNYPRPNCLLKCLPNCLSPIRESLLSSFKLNPAVRVIARQVRDKNCLAAICPATSICLFWPSGRGVDCCDSVCRHRFWFPDWRLAASTRRTKRVPQCAVNLQAACRAYRSSHRTLATVLWVRLLPNPYLLLAGFLT